MIRCMVGLQQRTGDRVVLNARQTKHLTTVLRLRPGDEFVVVLGEGDAQVAVLEAVSGHSATARCLKTVPRPPSEPWHVTLAAAIPRHPGAFDQIIDQSTQLGVMAIVPMVTARTVVRPDVARLDARRRRWMQLAGEAAQQSGRTTIPHIDRPMMFDELLTQRPAFDRLLMPAVQPEAHELPSALAGEVPRRILLLIGPEGDFTADEISRATACGAQVVCLGPTILRCETAAVVALAILIQTLRTHSDRKNPSL